MKKTTSMTRRTLWRTSWTKTDDVVLGSEVGDALDSDEESRRVFQLRQVWSVAPAASDDDVSEDSVS